MEDRRQLPPNMRGVRKMNGRKYVWLLNSDGTPEKHFLDEHRDKPKTKRPKDKK
jgi:hypothetical protein